MKTLRWTLLVAFGAWTALAGEAQWREAGTKTGTVDGPATVAAAKAMSPSVTAAGVKPIARTGASVAKPAGATPMSLYAVYGRIDGWVGEADADGDGYYDRFSFAVGIDADSYVGATAVYGRIVCETTGQYWWSADAWIVSGNATDYRYFAFDETDFEGRLSGNMRLDFTVEIYDASRTAHLATDASVDGEPLYADAAPAWFAVYGQVSDWTGLTDADGDGYYERYRFRIGVDGDVLPYSAIVRARLVCLTTSQYWWSADAWAISGTATDYRWFSFDEGDFAGHFTGNRQLDFRVELWDATRTVQLAATNAVAGEGWLRVDDYVALTRATLTIGGAGSGQIEVNGVVRALPFSASAPLGTPIVLRAMPAVGWRFDQWSGDLTGTADTVSFILSADRTATAVFAERPDAPPVTHNLVYTLAARGQRYATSTVRLTAAGYLVLDPDARLATVLLRWSDGRREAFAWHRDGLWYTAEGDGRRFQVLTAGSAAGPGDFAYGHLLGAEHGSTVDIGGGQRQPLSAAFGGTLRGGTASSFTAVELTARIDLAATRRYNDERMPYAELATLLGGRIGVTAAPSVEAPAPGAATAAGVAIYSLRLTGVEAGHGTVDRLSRGGYLVVELATGHVTALLAWRDGGGAWYRHEDWSVGTPIDTLLPRGGRDLVLLGNREISPDAETLRLLHGARRELALGGGYRLPVATALAGSLWQHDAGGNRHVQGVLRAKLLIETRTANDEGLSAAQAMAWLEGRLPIEYRPE